MMDANQVWDVDEAIDRDDASSRAFDPWWIEEPTSPDDVLGHARDRARRSRRSASRPASTCQNRVVFKQLMQAERDRLLPDRRLPARRRERGARRAAAGREVRRPGLPARRRRRPVRVRAAPRRCSTTSPSAASLEDRIVEYVDHCTSTSSTRRLVRDGRYVLPRRARLLGRDAARSRSTSSSSRRAPV